MEHLNAIKIMLVSGMSEKIVRAFLGAIPTILLITCIVVAFAAALGCASRVYQKIENKLLTQIT